MLATVLPKDAIKADGYLSRLQQFWLDAVAPLAAILEGAENGELTPEQAYSAAHASSPLLDGECEQSYGAGKAQKDFTEREPRLEIYGGGGERFPEGSSDAIWRGIHKESHG